MNCEKCIYSKFCRTKNGGKGAEACSLFVPEPTETELLKILKTATIYKRVAVIDDRTCAGCLEANGELLSAEEAFNSQVHQESIDDLENRCRCVLMPVEWEHPLISYNPVH